jgi:hypothetical protein
MRRKWVKGEFEDKNKYFRCPVCGTINHVDRNKPSDRMNTTVVDFPVKTFPYDTHSTAVVLDCISWLGSVIKRSSTFTTGKKTIINNGCWFCGNVKF